MRAKPITNGGVVLLLAADYVSIIRAWLDCNDKRELDSLIWHTEAETWYAARPKDHAWNFYQTFDTYKHAREHAAWMTKKYAADVERGKL